MTTHTKRLTAGASAAALLVALVAGCSSTPDDETSPSTNSSTSADSTPSSESTPTTEEAEDSAPADASATVVAFCADAQELIEGDAIDGVNPDDVDAVKAAVADMTAQIDASVAPQEIADDWAVFSGGMKQFLAAAQSVTVTGDAPDPAAQAEMDAAVEFMSSSELRAAEDNVDAFVRANCVA